MKLNEAISLRLQNLLNERGWNSYTVEKEGGIPRATLSLIIGQKRESVKLKTLYQIIATFGISLKEFFDDPLFEDLSD